MKESTPKKSTSPNRQVVAIIKHVQELELLNSSGQKKGIEIIDQCLQQLGRRDTDLLHLKGGLLELLGNYAEATKIYRQILRLIPHHLGATNDLADINRDKGNFQKALIYYNRTLNLLKTNKGIKGKFNYIKGEDYIHAIDGKAECLLALNKPKLAVKYLLDALKRYPYNKRLGTRFQKSQELYQKLG